MKLFFGKVLIKLGYLLHLPNAANEYIKTFAEIVVTNQYNVFKYIKKDSVVVDVGAFVGMFTLVASFLGKEVHSFEPNPETFKRLKWFAGWRKNVHLYNFGLGDTAGMKQYRFPKTCPAAGTFCDSDFKWVEKGTWDTLKAEIVTLDSLNLKPSFIKMDCEGYEAQVITGGRRTIDTYKPIIAMSAYHHPKDKEELPKELPNYVCTYNFDGTFEEDFLCVPK